MAASAASDSFLIASNGDNYSDCGFGRAEKMHLHSEVFRMFRIAVTAPSMMGIDALQKKIGEALA